MSINLKSITVLLTMSLFFACGEEKEPEVNTQDPKEITNNQVNNEIVTSQNDTSINEVNNDVSTSDINNNNEVKTTTNNTNNVLNQNTDSKVDLNKTTVVNTNEVTQNNLTETENQETKTETKVEPEISTVYNPENFEHDIWDALLKKYVTSSGNVNYKGFKSEKDKLEAYIKQLQAEYDKLKTWSKNKQLAYWINVYNAYTVKLIVDNYPVNSIKDINGGKPWDKKFIILGGTAYSLNNVENDIIRPRYKERRIHFAVNCASISCPKLLNQAYTEDNLNRKLTQQTKAFLANSSKNQLDKKKVKISKIFDWYKVDFTKNNDIIPFLKKYSDVEINDDAKVEYLEYNWNLNE